MTLFHYLCIMIDRAPILTVAFTGHRTYAGSADSELRTTIAELYRRGARRFRVGMAEGFDIAAGEAVVELQRVCNDIEIEAFIPYPSFPLHMGMGDQQRYALILQHAQRVEYASERYYPGVFHRRNDMLIEGTEAVVAWYNGTKGGTQYTIRRALQHGAQLINLYHDGQLRMTL